MQGLSSGLLGSDDPVRQIASGNMPYRFNKY